LDARSAPIVSAWLFTGSEEGDILLNQWGLPDSTDAEEIELRIPYAFGLNVMAIEDLPDSGRYFIGE